VIWVIALLLVVPKVLARHRSGARAENPAAIVARLPLCGSVPLQGTICHRQGSLEDVKLFEVMRKRHHFLIFKASSLKLHHFRNVVAIAEEGSLRAAARSMRVAQPAVTRSLSELERELGAPLFERRARGMILTPIGEAFVRRASAVLNEVKRARDEVNQLGGGSSGSVAVGLSIAPHISMLPQALRPFRTRYPDVQLHVIEGFYPTLESDLRDGSIDFYVGPAPDDALPAELLQEKLFDNTRTVLCRKNHPLGKARSLRELAGAEWATTSITQLAEDELKFLFESYGLAPPRLILRSQSALTLMVMLAHTDLLAMVPRQWKDFAPMADILSAINVQEPLPAPAIVLIRRRDVPLTPAAAYLAALLSRSVPRPRRR
jgi:LysR family transcriptional regulator, regulator of abg operon